MKVWLKWLKTFMDTPAEWHAFVIGWGDGVSFTRTKWQEIEEVKGEGHYYNFGVALGRFSIIGFITAMLDILI